MGAACADLLTHHLQASREDGAAPLHPCSSLCRAGNFLPAGEELPQATQLKTVLAQPDFLSLFHLLDRCYQQSSTLCPGTQRCSPEHCCHGCTFWGSVQPRGPHGVKRDRNTLAILQDSKQICQDGLNVWKLLAIPCFQHGALSSSLAVALIAPQKIPGRSCVPLAMDSTQSPSTFLEQDTLGRKAPADAWSQGCLDPAGRAEVGKPLLGPERRGRRGK